LAELGHAGIEITQFALGQPSLDEVFLTLTEHLVGNDDAITEKEHAA
jgi:ABC-2 type transport system ATP-binding protein